MGKIYGYNQKDVLAFAELLKTSSNRPLKSLFEEFSVTSGKAKGTVRNLYYEIVKRSNNDCDFCKKYFNGKPLLVKKTKCFTKEQEDWLVSQVFDGTAKGQSVRKTLLGLADGDLKLALRYQNKYRNLIVRNPDLFNKAKEQRGKNKLNSKFTLPTISDSLLNKLKSSINNLVERVALKEKEENLYLKKRVTYLEQENLRLSRLLYGRDDLSKAIKYFNSPTTTGVDVVQ